MPLTESETTYDRIIIELLPPPILFETVDIHFLFHLQFHSIMESVRLDRFHHFLGLGPDGIKMFSNYHSFSSYRSFYKLFDRFPSISIFKPILTTDFSKARSTYIKVANLEIDRYNRQSTANVPILAVIIMCYAIEPTQHPHFHYHEVVFPLVVGQHLEHAAAAPPPAPIANFRAARLPRRSA